jgi:hypothetical protein
MGRVVAQAVRKATPREAVVEIVVGVHHAGIYPDRHGKSAIS